MPIFAHAHHAHGSLVPAGTHTLAGPSTAPVYNPHAADAAPDDSGTLDLTAATAGPLAVVMGLV